MNKYSYPYLNILLKHLYSLKSFLFDATSFDHHHLAIICHSSSCLFTFQALSSWMGQMHIFWFLQKYLIGFKTRLWLCHSRTFTELSISHSCCVLRVTVLLEGKPSAQSEVLNALDWVVIKVISIFWCIELFFYSDESLSHAAWGCYQHTLLLGWYSAGDEQNWFSSNMMFGIEAH